MNRQAIAVAALLSAMLLAGCFGPAELSEEQLSGNATYDWDQDADAAYTLSRSSYQAVFKVDNRSTLSVNDRDALGVEAPVDLSTLKFRFTNGTIRNGSHPNLSATLQQRRTEITVPARDGWVAYTADRSGKQFTTPVVVPGRQTVTMPPGARVGVPLLSQVSPSDYSTTVSDNRMTITWANVSDGSLTANYYLERDLLLFSLLVLVAASVAVGGILFYLRQIRRLTAEREELGLDVEDDDDPPDRGPPPGMQ